MIRYLVRFLIWSVILTVVWTVLAFALLLWFLLTQQGTPEYQVMPLAIVILGIACAPIVWIIAAIVALFVREKPADQNTAGDQLKSDWAADYRKFKSDQSVTERQE